MELVAFVPNHLLRSCSASVLYSFLDFGYLLSREKMSPTFHLSLVNLSKCPVGELMYLNLIFKDYSILDKCITFFFSYVRKGKGKKEEEKPKEVTPVTTPVEEEINIENSQWVPPPDFILMDYINDASKIILPLTTTREQVVALAQWVPNCISISWIGKITVFLSKVNFSRIVIFSCLSGIQITFGPECWHI